VTVPPDAGRESGEAFSMAGSAEEAVASRRDGSG
jgi:hypothetical protein